MCWGGGQSSVPRLSYVEGGWQQFYEVCQTEQWGLGTRNSQRGDQEEQEASLVAMVIKE